VVAAYNVVDRFWNVDFRVSSLGSFDRLVHLLVPRHEAMRHRVLSDFLIDVPAAVFS
jgi:hypothetical protein